MIFVSDFYMIYYVIVNSYCIKSKLEVIPILRKLIFRQKE